MRRHFEQERPGLADRRYRLDAAGGRDGRDHGSRAGHHAALMGVARVAVRGNEACPGPDRFRCDGELGVAELEVQTDDDRIDATGRSRRVPAVGRPSLACVGGEHHFEPDIAQFVDQPRAADHERAGRPGRALGQKQGRGTSRRDDSVG